MFDVPEHPAWRIAELSEQEDDFWPCFDRDLTNKMIDFVDSIV